MKVERLKINSLAATPIKSFSKSSVIILRCFYDVPYKFFPPKNKQKQWRKQKNESNKKINSFFCSVFIIVTADVRAKRQDDDDNAAQNIEDLCQDRPGDEYFRLSSDGDCRDVVRYGTHPVWL